MHSMIHHNPEASTQCTLHKLLILLQLLVLSSVSLHCSVSALDTKTQNYTKLVSLSAPAITFISVLIFTDLFKRFILPLDRSPDAQKIRSTYACEAVDAVKRTKMCHPVDGFPGIEI